MYCKFALEELEKYIKNSNELAAFGQIPELSKIKLEALDKLRKQLIKYKKETCLFTSEIVIFQVRDSYCYSKYPDIHIMFNELLYLCRKRWDKEREVQ